MQKKDSDLVEVINLESRVFFPARISGRDAPGWGVTFASIQPLVKKPPTHDM